MRAIRYSAWTSNTNSDWPTSGRRSRRDRPAIYDYEYARRDSGTVWLFAEPLGPRGARTTPPPGARAWTGRARCSLSRIIRAAARPSA